MSVFPHPAKTPQGIPACLESDPPFLEEVQRVAQWHLHEISRTAGFLVRLAGFKWKLSVSAKWWPDTRTDFPISGIPHLMAGCDFPVCVCACSTCLLPHLKAVAMPSQGACRPRWTKRESGSLLLAGPAEAVSSFPQLKITVCRFYVRACRSRSGSLAAHQWAVKHWLLVPDAASAPFLLQRVCRSHFFWFLRTPQKQKTPPKVTVDLLSLLQHQAERLVHEPKGICVTLTMDLTADSQWTSQQEPEPFIKHQSIVTACLIDAAGVPAPRQSQSHFSRSLVLDRKEKRLVTETRGTCQLLQNSLDLIYVFMPPNFHYSEVLKNCLKTFKLLIGLFLSKISLQKTHFSYHFFITIEANNVDASFCQFMVQHSLVNSNHFLLTTLWS